MRQVLQASQILKHTAHGDIPGADHAETAGQIGDGTAGCKLFTQDVDGNREFAALAVLVCIPNQLNETERQEQA